MAWPLLALLLLTDCILINLHIWLWWIGSLDAMPAFNIEQQGSIAEYFNYLKWLACSLAALWLFTRERAPLYFVWSVLFFYCLVDDAESLRMIVGQRITNGLHFGPAFALTGQDLGEFTAASLAGVILLGALALAWLRNTDKKAAAFSWHLLPWLAALIFFGVGVDMVHAMFKTMPTLSFWLGVIEDGGEMICASVLTAIIAYYAFPVTRGVVLPARQAFEGAEPAEADPAP